jgi:hypothetical protein
VQAARQTSSVPNDLKKLATAIVDDPPDAASFIAHAMTGGNVGLVAHTVGRLVRMSPLISPILANNVWTPPAEWSLAQFQ